jgi:hypothetical protein
MEAANGARKSALNSRLPPRQSLPGAHSCELPREQETEYARWIVEALEHFLNATSDPT